MGNEFAHPDFIDLPSEANGVKLSFNGKAFRKSWNRGPFHRSAEVRVPTGGPGVPAMDRT